MPVRSDVSKVLVVLSAALAFGCVPKGGECTDNSACSSFESCATDLGVCVLKDCENDGQCGADGAICGSGGQCLPTQGCSPECGAHQICLTGTCEARYSGIEILEPAATTNDGNIVVRLQTSANGRPASGAALTYSIDGQSGSLVEDGEVYRGTWIPGADGQYTLTIAWEAAALTRNHIFTLDQTAPTLSLSIPIAPTRQPGAVDEANGNDPGLPDAYKRDERFTVSVSGGADVVGSTVELRVVGVKGAGPGAVGSAIPVVADTNCGHPYCGTAEVDLAQAEFLAPRGTVEVIATGEDPAGNVASTDAGVPVTRLRWAYSAPATHEYLATPAILSNGQVVAATKLGQNGEVALLGPEGIRAWAVSTGGVLASPVVGAPDGGFEPIYIAAQTGANSSKLLLLRSDTGDPTTICENSSGLIESSPALVHQKADEDSAAHEGVTYVINGGSAVLARRYAITKCVPGSSPGTVLFPGNIAATGLQSFFLNTIGSVRSFAFNPSTPPVLSGETNAAWNFDGFGLAIVEDQLVTPGGALGGLVAMELDGGIAWQSSVGADGWTPSIGPGNLTVTGLNDNSLGKAQVGGPTDFVTVADANSGAMESGASWGADGRLYLGTTFGEFQVRDPASLELLWSDNGLGPLRGGVALDCSRDETGTPVPGRPGVAYVPSTDGKLRAYVVDARGIDITAPWPKYQHDPRNTGNADTPLAQFACP